MNTNTNEFKKRVWSYLINSAYDSEKLTSVDTVREIKSAYVAAAEYPHNIQRFPNNQDRVADWLQGLPLGIEYTYSGILENYQDLHGEPCPPEKEEKIIHNYFSFMAFKLIQLFEYVESGKTDLIN